MTGGFALDKIDGARPELASSNPSECDWAFMDEMLFLGSESADAQ